MLNLLQKKEQKNKNSGKDGKALHKLMNNVVYGKTMQNLRKRLKVKLVSNKKTIQNGHPSQAICLKKILDSDSGTIHKKKSY